MFESISHRAQIAILSGVFLTGILFGHWIPDQERSVSARKINEVSTPAPVVAKVATTNSTSAPGPREDSPQLASSTSRRQSLREILSHRNAARTKELEEFANGLSSSEIGAALKELRRLPDNGARELALRLLIAHWADVDPEGALQFAAQNREFSGIASDVFQQFAGDDLQAALARAQNITDPNLRYQALRGVLSYMADQDPLGALKLAGTLGSFPNNEPLNQVIYRQWSEIDPQAAAAQAALDSNEGWRSPVGQVLRNWTGQDPLAAIAWSTSLPDIAAQERDVSQIIRQWSRNDPSAAANWVNSATPGSVRDAAAASLAFSITATDPAAALGWAESIEDPAARDNALQRLSREIMVRNPSNGAAILQAAGVPANLIPAPPSPNQPPRGRRSRN
jgi:hypothetical protein